MNSFYTDDELKNLGFKKIGSDIKISRLASFYGISNISIGNHVRIDDFCVLSGKIELQSYIHISAFSALYGNSGIAMEDYTGLSPRTTVFSEIDDFSGNYLIGPMVDNQCRNLLKGPVIIKKYTQIGANVVIFPNLTIEEGIVVGAMSLVKNSLDPWGIYAGIPAKRIKERSKNLLKFISDQGIPKRHIEK